MTYLKAFTAGFLSTLVFHQGLLWLLYAGGLSPRKPWEMTPVPPLNAPAVISLAFWGGVWGIVLWALIGASRGGAYWARALVIGALGPSLVGWFVAMPMKSMAVAGGWDPKSVLVARLLNPPDVRLCHWRRGRDSNPRCPLGHSGFQDRRL